MKNTHNVIIIEDSVGNTAEKKQAWVAPQIARYDMLSDTASGPSADTESNNGHFLGSP